MSTFGFMAAGQSPWAS